MGFTTMLDIIGSMIIGGILMTIAWRLSDAATEKTYNNTGELTIQQNLLTVAQMVEFDFRKIGYVKTWTGVQDPRGGAFQSNQAIVYADSSRIKFYTDLPASSSLEGDGNIDSVTYYLGPTSECLGTPNPRDRILYRVENDDPPVKSNLGVTRFHLTYYDVGNDSIASPVVDPNVIQNIEIDIVVEDVAAYDQKYSNAFWKQIRLASRNMSRAFLKE
jgi:hypothetical protein